MFQFFYGQTYYALAEPALHPFGRRPFGPVQAPPGGTDYPFINPSDDVKYLLGDVQLYFVDDEQEFEPPFSVKTLWGFESGNADLVTGSGNNFDILIVDANDATVFDSRTGTTYSERDWFERATVIHWKKDDATCKVIRHYAWSAGDIEAGLRVIYPTTLEPENGELHPTCVVRQPANIRRLIVGAETIDDIEVHLVGGYNTEFTIAADETGRDGRRTDNILMDMQPGLGEGRVPGCSEEPEDRDLTYLADAVADSRGAVYVEGDGCITVERAEERDGEDYVFPTEADESTLRIYNRCFNPCDADAYTRTYEGARRVFNRWKAVADQLVEAKSILDELIALWENERCCRSPINVVMGLQPQGLCKLGGGIVICNATNCDVEDVRITLVLDTTNYEGTGPVSCQLITDTGLKGEYEPLAQDTPFPNLSYTLPGFPSNVSRAVSARISLPGCIETTEAKAYVLISFVAPEEAECEFPVVSPPPGVDAPPEPLRAWYETRVVTMKPLSEYCESCDEE